MTRNLFLEWLSHLFDDTGVRWELKKNKTGTGSDRVGKGAENTPKEKENKKCKKYKRTDGDLIDQRGGALCEKAEVLSLGCASVPSDDRKRSTCQNRIFCTEPLLPSVHYSTPEFTQH